MSFVYRINLLWHAWVLHENLNAFQADDAALDLVGFELKISARNRYYRFYPRFIVSQGDRIAYLPRPHRDMYAFAGWLPYVNRRWPIGSGKFAFKEFCARQGLPTPQMWHAPQPGMRDFLVKHDQMSSGTGMRGPFREYEPGNAAQALPPGGYYERFVPGQIVKSWYWEDRLAALEMVPMPAVTGDGRSTLRELISPAQRRMAMQLDWSKFEELARYQDAHLDGVVGDGRTLIADCRYASPLMGGSSDNTPSLDRYRGSPVVAELQRLGPIFRQGIPEDVGPAVLYSVDAIVDADDKLWLLEMNCNPAVHPDAYPHMLETLFGPRGELPVPARTRAANPPQGALTAL